MARNTSAADHPAGEYISSATKPRAGLAELHACPIRRPRKWREFVNEPEAEVKRLRESIQRARPYGDSPWMRQTARELGIESSLRPRGRPKKVESAESAEKVR